MDRHVIQNADIPDRGKVLPGDSGCTVLRDEREKRRMSRKELGLKAGMSAEWIRDIETKGENPGPDARERLRKALEQCPVHADFKIPCNHKLPVPPDEELYAKRQLLSGERDA
jgi:transcriptional regulator with XRE-family HTH domain